MKCKCGYSFLNALLKKGKPGFESYALINDKDYRKFIRAEMKVMQAKDRKSKLAALSRSTKYVGTLMKCPRCSRISIFDPTRKLGKLYTQVADFGKDTRRSARK